MGVDVQIKRKTWREEKIFSFSDALLLEMTDTTGGLQPPVGMLQGQQAPDTASFSSLGKSASQVACRGAE